MGRVSTITVHHGDSRDVLKGFADNSIDSCVCDPPYALVSILKRFGGDDASPAQSNGASGVYARASAGFMGQKWDTGETAFDPAFWAEVLRVLKPGGHLIAASGSRTYDLLVTAIRGAGFDLGGFEIRDTIFNLLASDTFAGRFMRSLSDEQLRAMTLAIDEGEDGGMLQWLYGSGFPKSHNVSKGLDKAAGAERRVIAEGKPVKRMIPGADQARDGWEKANGRTFTPAATEAAKRFSGWGTALKPACEPWVMARKPLDGTVAANALKHGTGGLNIDGCRVAGESTARLNHAEVGYHGGNLAGDYRTGSDGGRWPANVIHDGSREVVDVFPTQAGAGSGTAGPSLRGENVSVARGRFNGLPAGEAVAFHDDKGSAARFFYSSKADAEDRLGSKHPTVKPVDLMAWLCRLVTPAGGLVLDPFAGSGSTGVACLGEGFDCILIEREADYIADIHRRLAWAKGDGRLTTLEMAKLDTPAARATAGGADLPLFGGAAA